MTSEMMTAERLREIAERGIFGFRHGDYYQAADTIEAQAKEIARLSAQLTSEKALGKMAFSECAVRFSEMQDRALLAEADAARLRDALRVAEGALRKADQFVTNGVELGYIRLPDAVTDPALATPGAIKDTIDFIAPLLTPPDLKDSDTAAQGEGNRS